MKPCLINLNAHKNKIKNAADSTNVTPKTPTEPNKKGLMVRIEIRMSSIKKLIVSGAELSTLRCRFACGAFGSPFSIFCVIPAVIMVVLAVIGFFFYIYIV